VAAALNQYRVPRRSVDGLSLASVFGYGDHNALELGGSPRG
jgi:hypothetical protein